MIYNKVLPEDFKSLLLSYLFQLLKSTPIKDHAEDERLHAQRCCGDKLIIGGNLKSGPLDTLLSLDALLSHTASVYVTKRNEAGVVCKMATILSRPQCIQKMYVSLIQLCYCGIYGVGTNHYKMFMVLDDKANE